MRLVIILLPIFVMASYSAAAASTAQDLLSQAQSADSREDRIRILREAVKAATDVNTAATAYFELGAAYKESKRYNEAIKAFDASLGRVQNAVDPLLEKAHCLILTNKLSDASRALERILSVKHGIARAYALKAAVYEKQGFFSKAEDELTRALHYNPHSASALEMRARLLMRAGKPTQALQDVNTLCMMARHRPEVFVMRARIHVGLKDYDQALKDYEMAERLASVPDNVVKEKVLVYFEMDRPKKVLETLALLAKKGEEDSDALILRARAYIRLKSHAAAENTLNRVLRQTPSHPQAHLYMGVSAMKRERWDEAFAHFNRTVELDPTSPVAFKERARTFMKLGEHVRAIKDLTAAAALDPSDGEIFLMRGDRHARRKLYNAAIEDYTLALERIPGDPGILYARAYAYVEKEELDAALQDLDLLLQTHPRSCPAICLRGLARMKKGMTREALADFDEAVACAPKRADMYNNRGFFRYKTGDYDGAVNDFNRATAIYPAYDTARYNLKLVERKRNAEKQASGTATEPAAPSLETLESDDKP